MSPSSQHPHHGGSIIVSRSNRNDEMNNNQIFLDEAPARVANVHFDGVGRTKQDVLMKISKELMDAKNFEDLLIKANTVKTRLGNLNAFKGVGITIDAAKGDYNYDVTFTVVEANRITGGIHTMIGSQNSGSITTDIGVPNFAGRGESAKLSYEYGSKTLNGFNFDVSKPLAPWTNYNPQISLNCFQKGYSNPWNGLNETNRGSNIGWNCQLTELVRHSALFNSSVASFFATGIETPFKARLESGHFMKTSINNKLVYDSRDSTALPTNGAYASWSNEIAGLLKSGNVNFMKNEVEFQQNASFWAGNIIFQSTLKAGIVKTPNVSQKPKLVIVDPSRVPMNDRFNLGGPLNLRGYAINGIGPHDSWAALGGNAYWVFGTHIYLPVPFGSHLKDFVRTHIFFNSGSLETVDFSKNQDLLNVLSGNVRKSVGIGLVLVFGAARLELNYSFPILGPNGSGQDRVDRGVQFGIGATFT